MPLSSNVETVSAVQGNDKSECYRAAAIQALLGDETRLQQERDMYRQRRNTYQGFAREDVPATAGQPFAGNVEVMMMKLKEAQALLMTRLHNCTRHSSMA